MDKAGRNTTVIANGHRLQEELRYGYSDMEGRVLTDWSRTIIDNEEQG